MNFALVPSPTKVRFYQALTELLAEKTVDKITITELSKRAGLSRKTFYVHFQTVEDVLEDLQNTMLVNTTSIGDIPGFSTDPSVIPSYIDAAFKEPYTGPYTIEIMFHDLKAINKYREITTDLLLSSWENIYSIKRDRLHLYAHAVISGVTQIYYDWANMKRPLPTDELKAFVTQYLKGAFETLEQMEKDYQTSQGTKTPKKMK